uniref:Uncharacterized protein n=1 Tax=Timema bartmani TaxID=61472 RepID=A0A7R9EPG0_9NEOP|nr:unnamed protein product [Timema bartmani]
MRFCSEICLRIRIANLVFKLLTCLLYIGRVCSDNDPIKAACYDCPQSNKSEFYEASTLTEEEFQETPIINWDAILWVNRPLILWIIQVILAVISLIEALLLAYLGYKTEAAASRSNEFETSVLDRAATEAGYADRVLYKPLKL